MVVQNVARVRIPLSPPLYFLEIWLVIKLLSFPCQFTIKVMGINHNDFVSEVINIVSSFCQSFDPKGDLLVKSSAKGNYLSLSVTINAISQEQLDQIYITLNQHKLVKVTL